MATSYTYARLLLDPSVNKKKKSLKSRAANLAFLAYYEDFYSEFKSRCPGKPVQTNVVRKLYPEVIRIVKENRKKRLQKSRQKYASQKAYAWFISLVISV